MRKRDDDAILLRMEMAASLAAKNAWEKKYKRALKSENERITRVVVEEEARRKKLLDIKIELHVTKEVAINKVAKKFTDNLCKKREWEENSEELYREKQRWKWAKEPAILTSRKQYTIAESLKETARRQKAVAERRAKDEMIDAAFTKYLTEGREKDIGKERKYCDARRTRSKLRDESKKPDK